MQTSQNDHRKTITISQQTGINISIAFLITIAGLIVSITSYASEMSNQVEGNTETIKELKTQNSQLQTDNTDAKIKLTEIQTQLKSIDATLIEIKEKLK